ncbi:multidrug efflux SMR transporter [Rossellomorea aquimaris]|jgi:quaternary ammonium compound-resistance protein SugE|uniref:Multidrug efflux SMR transporter n=1 Tax=Rossellomorea aquimaris TaxID=189382 RepID=A0A5D4TWG3_9BACI|nr:multidrug efflux SMR transporter [Rossellomorea aquimaris]TYS75202.1 multidrug efflux SMR transporter [Rossellomorea aquimaris]TYS79579.1 multidrug efflux SMR transporter [Rossellomorea aquimaris]
MGWIYVIIGGILEIGWATGLSLSEGFTKPVPSIVTAVLILISFYFFSNSMKLLPIGTAYAVFTGIGAAGTAVVGMVFLNDGISILKVAFITLLIFGVIGLKMSDKEEQDTGRSY